MKSTTWVRGTRVHPGDAHHYEALPAEALRSDFPHARPSRSIPDFHPERRLAQASGGRGLERFRDKRFYCVWNREQDEGPVGVGPRGDVGRRDEPAFDIGLVQPGAEPGQIEHLLQAQVGLHRLAEGLPDLRDAPQPSSTQPLAIKGPQDLLLASAAVKVAGGPARADVPESMKAIQVLDAGVEVYVHALLGVFRVGKRVVELALYGDIHPAQGVHNLHEPVEVHQSVVVDGDAEVVFHRRLDQRRPTSGVVLSPGIGRVDFCKPVVGNPGVIVPGDGEHADGGDLRVDTDDNHHVGAPAVGLLRVHPQKEDVHHALRQGEHGHRGRDGERQTDGNRRADRRFGNRDRGGQDQGRRGRYRRRGGRGRRRDRGGRRRGRWRCRRRWRRNGRSGDDQGRGWDDGLRGQRKHKPPGHGGEQGQYYGQDKRCQQEVVRVPFHGL